MLVLKYHDMVYIFISFEVFIKTIISGLCVGLFKYSVLFILYDLIQLLNSTFNVLVSDVLVSMVIY